MSSGLAGGTELGGPTSGLHFRATRRAAPATTVSTCVAPRPTPPDALVTGVEVTRQDVIDYVANKLGSAYYDPSRARRGDDRLRYLDLTLLRYMPFGGPPIDFAFAELPSIAEFLVESSDVARFLARFKQEERPQGENPREG